MSINLINKDQELRNIIMKLVETKAFEYCTKYNYDQADAIDQAQDELETDIWDDDMRFAVSYHLSRRVLQSLTEKV